MAEQSNTPTWGIKAFLRPGVFLRQHNQQVAVVLSRMFMWGWWGIFLVPVAALVGGLLWPFPDPDPQDKFGGIEHLSPFFFALMFNPAWLSVMLAVALNVFFVARIVAGSKPGTYSASFWQSCGAWHGWFFPGVSLLTAGRRVSGVVASVQWVFIGTSWLLTIPVLWFSFWFAPGMFIGDIPGITMWKVLAFGSVFFGIFSTMTTSDLWLEKYQNNERATEDAVMLRPGEDSNLRPTD